MKGRFKFTPLTALIAAAIGFAALSAVGLVQPSAADDNAETDRCLMEELTLHPDNATAHYFRGLLHMKMADLPTARAELDAARRLDPTAAFAGGPAVLDMVERDMAAPPAAISASRSRVPFSVAAAAVSAAAALVSTVLVSARRKRRAAAPVAP